MRCFYPRQVGLQADGKTIAWSQKTFSKEYATFQVPCGKCLACRLENARQTAVRCVHEAQMHENNAFITLTYNEENLKSPKLQYKDFQAFVKALRTRRFDELTKTLFPTIPDQHARRSLYRKLPEERRKELYEQIQISIYVAGEYGDRNQRPHWHALVFNWSPPDPVYKYSNARGDKAYTSDYLTSLWPHGNSEFGSVTFESAGYCARYASKKLKHGKDGTHDFEPISRRSSKNAIGKKWLETFWPDVFSYGKCTLADGTETGIPRYYEKWFKEKKPDEWMTYVTQIKINKCAIAAEKSESIRQEWIDRNLNRYRLGKPRPLSPEEIRKIILEDKFEKLQQHLKL